MLSRCIRTRKLNMLLRIQIHNSWFSSFFPFSIALSLSALFSSQNSGFVCGDDTREGEREMSKTRRWTSRETTRAMGYIIVCWLWLLEIDGPTMWDSVEIDGKSYPEPSEPRMCTHHSMYEYSVVNYYNFKFGDEKTSRYRMLFDRAIWDICVRVVVGQLCLLFTCIAWLTITVRGGPTRDSEWSNLSIIIHTQKTITIMIPDSTSTCSLHSLAPFNSPYQPPLSSLRFFLFCAYFCIAIMKKLDGDSVLRALFHSWMKKST